MMVNIEQDPGRYRIPDFPFVNPTVFEQPDYNPNYELIKKRLNTGYVEMEKFEQRKCNIMDPEFEEPHKFHQSIDNCNPNYEILANHRRTDSSFVKMRTTKARDNAMYRLTETWNLDVIEENKYSEPSFVCDKYMESF